MLVSHRYVEPTVTLYVHLDEDTEDVTVALQSPLTSVSLTLHPDDAKWLRSTLLTATEAELPGHDRP